VGIPTQPERARQTLGRPALAPQWDAKRSPHTEGCRPGRACGDAIAAVLHRSTCRPQSMLKGAISPGLACRNPAAFLAQLHAPPGIRRHLRAW